MRGPTIYAVNVVIGKGRLIPLKTRLLHNFAKPVRIFHVVMSAGVDHQVHIREFFIQIMENLNFLVGGRHGMNLMAGEMVPLGPLAHTETKAMEYRAPLRQNTGSA